MTDNNLINQLFTQINNMIDYKMSQQTLIKSAVVHSINSDLTVNVYIPPDHVIYHNIQNQSVYRNLNAGDNVKVLIENGNLSSMWIIGGFNLTSKNQDIDKIYPVGSIYLSVNPNNPSQLFGGQWEQIKDTFLLSAGDVYTAGNSGGESTHTLTNSELPSHSHAYSVLAPAQYEYYSSPGSIEYINGCVSGGSTHTGSTGLGQPHNNMPPYLVVYMWKRIS